MPELVSLANSSRTLNDRTNDNAGHHPGMQPFKDRHIVTCVLRGILLSDSER